MKMIRFGAAASALLALAACGGSASKSDVVAACKASVSAQEQELARKYSSYKPVSADVMEEKLECCSRTIGGKIPGGALSFLLKEYEYRTLRSTSDDDAAVMKAQEDLSEARSRLSDKEREAASDITMAVSACAMRAKR
jgi:hypothetical protein